MMVRRSSPVVAALLAAILTTFGTIAPSARAAAPPLPTWSIVPSPNTDATHSNQLYAISCASAAACSAVGYYSNGTADQTLIEQWNGTAWSIVASPDTSATQDNDLYGVSCASASACTAVGHYYDGAHDRTLIEQWNGTAWSIVSSPNTSATQRNDLYGVSCTSAPACTAVGSYDNGTNTQTLIEQWNGTAWSIVSSPDTSAIQDNYFNGVSCTSAPACTAVGSYSNGSNTQTLIEQWNGTAWSIVSSPDTSATQNNYFNGVSCTSASACIAVGSYNNGTNTQTLVEQWNGTAWSIVSSPDTNSTLNNVLYGVSCTSASACTAAGVSDNGTRDQTLVEQWNGAAWSIASSPNADAAQNNLLEGISCTWTSGCTAAGTYYNGTASQTLIEALPWSAGYWEVASDGGLFSFGSAQFYGSTGSMTLNQPIVGMAATPDGKGYWEGASDGGIFSWGDASFHGSTGSMTLNQPIVGMAATPDGKGYWEVASDGGIFSWGDASFHGSTGSMTLNQPIVGMAATPDGMGYWEVASDGGIFSWGDASFHGSTGNITLNQPIVGMAATPDGKGYWEVASDGGLFAFGDAAFLGSMGGKSLNQPIVGMG